MYKDVTINLFLFCSQSHCCQILKIKINNYFNLIVASKYKN